MRDFTFLFIALAILNPGIVLVNGATLPGLEKGEDNDLKIASTLPENWDTNWWPIDKDGNVETDLGFGWGSLRITVNATFTVRDVKTAIFKKVGSPFCPYKVRIYRDSDLQTPLKTHVLIKPVLDSGDWLYMKCPSCKLEDKDCEKRHKLRVKGIQKNGI